MVECAIFATNRLQLVDPPSFSTLVCQNILQYHNSIISLVTVRVRIKVRLAF